MVSSSATVSASYASKRPRSPEKPPPRKITLKIKNSQNGAEDVYRVAADAPLKKLMVAYCDKKGLDYKIARFVYESILIKKLQTPVQLSMEEGDQIDMFMEVGGGGPYVA